MHRINAVLAAFLVVAACGGPVKQDPKAPALEPAVIDTRPAESASTPQHQAPAKPKISIIPASADERMLAVLQGYAMVTATTVRQDGRMLGFMYHTNATLQTPDSTYSGVPAVVTALLAQARAKSLSDFQRQSKVTRIVDDSTLSDSGSYFMVLKRSPKDSTIEKGTYVAEWRARPKVTDWVILADHLFPSTPKKKSAK